MESAREPATQSAAPAAADGRGKGKGKGAGGGGKEDGGSLSAAMVVPLALTLAYLWALFFVADHTGTDSNRGWPAVFKESHVAAPIAATVGYFAMIFFGTKYMNGREAFSLKNEMFVYNTYQTLLNLWTVYAFISHLVSHGMPMWGNPYDNSKEQYPLARLVWLHYANKYVELFDTVFMVFRKKSSQVTFLHVYHHVLLVWSWWCVCIIAPGGDAYFGGCCNSFIHVIMYAYYLLASLNIPFPFKKYITSLQMVQFVFCATHSCYVFYNGHLPVELAGLQLFVMVNMLVLFGNFFRQAYTKKPKKSE